MGYQQFTGKDINEAIANACNALKIMSSDIEYKIISEGKQKLFSSEPAIIEARKKDVDKQMIKNIDDNNLTEGDVVKHYCDKCDENVIMKIIFAPEGIIGICNVCRKFTVIKKNEDYIPEQQTVKNIPKCPICQSTNLKKITFTKRAVKTAVFGVVGAVDDAGKTYQCINCGSKF